MTTRRLFLAGLGALALPTTGWSELGSPACLAAGRSDEGHVLHGLTERGESLFALALPGRGHAAAAHPHLPLAVAFARRPGTFAIVLDCRDGKIRHHLTPPQGRQFNGHGVFSGNGRVLYTSEVVASTSEGRIGLWDTTRFMRIGEWSSGGIGPHDLKRQDDGTLIVANGGIATDPADRSKLNIDSMRPNLARLSADGRIVARAELPAPFRQNSIRHLALGQDGLVAFAMQWEGDPSEAVPLLGMWRPGTEPVLCSPPAAEAMRMHGYAGSIAMNRQGLIALTSPRGGVVMIHGPDGAHLATHARADICGVAPSGKGFLASDGSGVMWSCTTSALSPLVQGGPAWDNHLVALI
ncbi:DUF1513 domain-containing protein [Paracoccus sp. (in: a-proteobacteria)]|uniref:DUF1513 domain-containing protein n=1 Tax=Paracoccus sp. TaxID=267 RepID=UPI00396CFDE6